MQIYTSERRGRLCYTQHVPIGHIGTISFNSFRWKASRLFNSLPANIRNTTNCETSVFKKKVDSYLQTILDNPCVPNEDNSLDARINEMRWCREDQAIRFQLTFLVCESEPFYEQLKLLLFTIIIIIERSNVESGQI